MQPASLLLVDSDDYTASLILDFLNRNGLSNIHRLANSLELHGVLKRSAPDLVIFNYHAAQSDSLMACSTIKLICPDAAIITIVSPGPTLKAVQKFAKEGGCIDAIIQKPLSEEHLCTQVNDLLQLQLSNKSLAQKTDKLTKLVPEAALSAVNQAYEHEAEIFEAAILFSDIRGSSKLIREMAPRDFFDLLNEFLSDQTILIQQYEGSVVKYTGDGVMAIFRGMGRSYLALRCGLALAEQSKKQKLACGIGISEGLVLAGLIGDAHQSGQRRQYDVIGANVHLAARLCSLANVGEVITTKRMNSIARLNTPAPKEIGGVSVRGFDSDIDCVAFDLNQ